MADGDAKVATVTSENLDTMATLPISVSRYSHQQHSEKSASAAASHAKEQEANSSKPHYVYHQIKRLVRAGDIMLKLGPHDAWFVLVMRHASIRTSCI